MGVFGALLSPAELLVQLSLLDVHDSPVGSGAIAGETQRGAMTHGRSHSEAGAGLDWTAAALLSGQGGLRGEQGVGSRAWA